MPTVTTTKDGRPLGPSQTLAQAIAAELGESWHYEQPAETDYAGRILGEGGLELWVSLRGYGEQAWRATIDGSYPTRDANGSYHQVRNNTKIHVDSRRAPAALARDVRRRLLPGYLAEFARQEATIAEWNASIALTAATIRHVAEAVPTILGGTERDGRRSISVAGDGDRDIWGTVRASGASVTIDVSGVPRDVAVAMLRVLAESRCGQ